MVSVLGVEPEDGTTESQFPPDCTDAAAVKVRLPDEAVTSTVVVTAVRVPAFAFNETLLELTIRDAPFACPANAAKTRPASGENRQLRAILNQPPKRPTKDQLNYH